MTTRFFKNAALGLLLLALCGCGYQLSNTGKSQLPAHIRTLAIPIISNSSGEPEIHRELTDEIRRAFISDGRLKVVDEGKADLILKGSLVWYNLRAVSFSADDFVSEYWVEIKVDFEATDVKKKRPLLKQQLKTKWDFRATENVISTEQARIDAIDQSFSDLSSRIVSLLIDRF
ncbi:MAG: LptE family protein [Candidatus Nitrohelix vancouverensis]|uniref:LptE family protein n=1 Tax=Candidatus Nitrohelix vancouverensis TaxID=2705534 RepID=A0A7T0G2U4_9BACT|nr:MAG: LptE family protein [Candidatus Nitrohelix vancouverensis]